MDYFVHLMIMAGIYMILAQSFNLVFGLGGLFNLAHVASYAIGAYAAALLSVDAGISFVFCVVAGAALCGFFALLIGGISARLSQDYFAIGTLAFSSLVSALLINWKSLTRGVLGIPGIPRPALMEVDFYSNRNFLFLVICVLLLAQGALFCLFRGPLSRTLRAQAEYEQAAWALGKNTARARNTGFCLASMFAGLAGALFTYYINYIDPSSFALSEMIFVLAICIVGRPGSFWGCLAAAVFLVLLPEPLRFIEISPGVLGPVRQMLYALIMFVVVYVNRAKLFPAQRTV